MRRALLTLLPFVIVLNGINLSFRQYNFRIEQIYIIALWLYFLIRFFRFKPFYIDRSGVILFLFIIIAFASSIINAPDYKYSMIQTFNITSVLSIYYLMPNLIITKNEFIGFINKLFWVSSILVILGLILFVISYLVNTPLFGINLVQNEAEAFGVFMTFREPNIFASFLMINLLLSFSMYSNQINAGSVYKNKYLFFFCIFLIGIFITFTRAVWLASFLFMIFFLFKNITSIGNLIRVFGIGLFIMVIVFFLNNYLKIEFLSYKFQNIFQTESGTGYGRLVTWFTALDNWIINRHYLIGTGTYSFASYFNDSSYDVDSNAWIGNLVIQLLHDYGLIGFLLYILFNISLLSKVKNILKPSHLNKQNQLFYSCGDGIVYSILAIFITFFFTVAISYAYPWVLFGLASSFYKIGQKLNNENYNVS